MSRKHLKILALLLPALFLAMEKPAYADVPMLWDTFGAGISLYMLVLTRGAALVVVIVIEGIVFKRMFGFGWREALLASFWLNIFSTAIGFFLGIAFSIGGCALITIVLTIAAIIIIKGRLDMPWWYALLAIACILAGWIIGAIRSDDVRGLAPASIAVPQIMLTLLLGFGLTIIVESLIAVRVLRTIYIWNALLWANLASYIFLAALAAVFMGKLLKINIESGLFF
jgi:hypothetical protein